MQSKLHETNDELSDIILRLNSTNSEKKKKKSARHSEQHSRHYKIGEFLREVQKKSEAGTNKRALLQKVSVAILILLSYKEHAAEKMQASPSFFLPTHSYMYVAA